MRPSDLINTEIQIITLDVTIQVPYVVIMGYADYINIEYHQIFCN